MSKCPLQPLGDRIIAEREEAESKTPTGLYLPASNKEKSQIAKVVAVGKDVKDIKIDDRIVVLVYSATDIKINEDKYLIVKEEDVLAIVE